MSGTQMNRAAGVLFLVFPALIVVSLILGAIAVGGTVDPDRDGIEGSLEDINDNEALYLLSLAFDTASNVVSIALAAAFYILFRGRDRLLALLTFGGLIAASATFMFADVGGFTLHRLADDLAEGGAGGAGDAEVLELARAVAWMVDYSVAVSFSLLGASLIALGALIALSPASGGVTTAASTVPRWVGWLVAAGGIAALLVWLAAIQEDLFVIAGVGTLVALVGMLALGVWLLRAAEEPEVVT